jgi:S1-C subfamily serine protease
MLSRVKDRKYPLLLLLVAGAILAIGLVLKPVQSEQKKRPPSDLEVAQLQRLTQQRRLRDLSSYLTDAANATAPSLVFLSPQNRTGVMWDSGGLIVTAPVSATTEGTTTALTEDGRSIALVRRPVQDGVPFQAFSTSTAERTIRRGNGAAPNTGDWVLAVARNADGNVLFAHGLYQGVEQLQCGTFAYRAVQSSAPLSTALEGGALFTLDGERLGLIADCEQRPIVIAAESIADALRKPPSIEERLEQSLGIRIAGSIVVAVWERSRGREAGLQPGDAIISADEKEIASANDLEGLFENGEHTLKVRRGRRVVSIGLPSRAPDAATAQESTSGLNLRDGVRGPSVSSVDPDSAGQRAGVLPGDVVLRAGKSSVTSAAEVVRALRDAKNGGVLTLERGGKEFEVLLTP